MRRTLTFCSASAVVLACVLTLPSPSAQSRRDPAGGTTVDADDAIEAEVKGTFGKAAAQTGEHTRFHIAANGLTWEVDVSANPRLAATAGRLDGKPALVTGTYAERRDASSTRRILTARTLEAAPQTAERSEYIDVTVRGTVQTGLMAIGGETTGTLITVGPVTWELALDGRQQKIAHQLSGRRAVVSGELRQVRGVEIRRRLILSVRNIGPA